MGKKVLKSSALQRVRRGSEQTRKQGLKKKKSKVQPKRPDRQLDNVQQQPQPTAPRKKLNRSKPSAKPETVDNYGSQAYWDSRHADKADFESKFEWFLGYQDLKPILESSAVDYELNKALFIDLGCGTSRFLMELKADGYQGPCLGLDYSPEAIDRMQDCGEHEVEYRVADATKFTQEDGMSNRLAKIVLDKSLMDTMLHQEAEGHGAVQSMLREVVKVLENDSTFIVVTQLDPSSAKDASFLTEVVVRTLTEEENEGKFLSGVLAHVTNQGDKQQGSEDVLPVPTVFVFQFKPVAERTEDFVLEMEIVEYEAGEEDSDDESEA
ncbi:hypothetical protein BASA81_012384 [Batrachochytrium salamandrivorans]|nr:hypothetical protein BASA81_012384 [Batrachochytrium salamandrivorans]